MQLSKLGSYLVSGVTHHGVLLQPGRGWGCSVAQRTRSTSQIGITA